MCESEDMLDKVTEDLAASKQENQTLKDEVSFVMHFEAI